MLAFTGLSRDSVNVPSTSGRAATHEFDLVVAGSGSWLRGRRPRAVALESPAAGDRVERGIEDAVQLRCEPGVLHLHHHFDATVEVAVHHVGAADPVLVAAP